MSNLINFLKTHKLAVLFLLVIFFLLGRNSLITLNSVNRGMMYDSFDTTDGFSGMSAPIGSLGGMKQGSGVVTQESYAPTPTQNRMVVTESYVSMQVNDVTETLNTISNEVDRTGGFVISTYVNRPEESASGHITVRVPSNNLKQFLTFLRDNSVKVVNENIEGQDVTDRYSDLNAKLNILNRNKERYMAIMEAANTVDEILRVQSQIFSLQDQIDSITGQIMMLEKTSSTSLISVNLSTDELALPFTPDGAWRPQLVYKQAVRSLVGTLRDLGNAAIWLGVYAIIWVPAILIFILVRRFLRKRRSA